MTQFYAYIYRDPSRANEPIYIGKGSGRRAWAHLKPIKRRHPFTQRLNKMIRENVQPDIEVIDAIDEDHAFFLEKCLIAVIGRKDLGKGPLLNRTDGGEGDSGKIISDETRRKMSEAQRRVQGAAQNRPEVKAERVKIATRLMSDPERRAKISASCKQTLATPEVKAKLSEAQRKAAATDAGKLQRIMATKGRIWVNNGKQCLRVLPAELTNMPGFVKGRKFGDDNGS